MPQLEFGERPLGADAGDQQHGRDLAADLDRKGHRRVRCRPARSLGQVLRRPRWRPPGALRSARAPRSHGRPASCPGAPVPIGPLREPLAGLEPEDAVGLAREERHDIGVEQLGDRVDDRGHDPRPVEVGDERPADREHALDGVQPVAPLIVEPGRPEGGRQRVDDHLGERDLRRADRMLERPLEVHDAEQLAAVDDRRRDLAPNVVACRAIVGVDEDVGDELGLLGLRRRVR